jgi:hypothetical protein
MRWEEGRGKRKIRLSLPKSLLKIQNAKRDIKDFWEEIGLQNSFYKIKEKYDKINIEKGEKNG